MGDLLHRVVRATDVPADCEAVLHALAGVLAGEAELVLADRLDDPDLVTRVAALADGSPLELPEALGRPAARRSSAGAVGILPSVLAAPGHVLRLAVADLQRVAEGDDLHAARQATALLEGGIRDVVVQALVARGTPVAVLTLGARASLSPDLLDELPDVARHAATALDAARLLTLQNAVASAMQHSLLPPLPAVPGLSFAARYVPAARGLDVGGDWYDAFRTSTDVVVAIGDVMGHDLAAAARMADLRNLLRAHAIDGDLAPDALLRRLADTAELLGLDCSATVTVGRLSQHEGGWLLRWCNAGHPPPVLLRGGTARLLDEVPDLMLCVDEESPRTTHELVLDRGDLVVLYTDGLVEQRGADLDVRLEQLRATVEAHADAQPDGLAERLLCELATSAADDVALLVVAAG